MKSTVLIVWCLLSEIILIESYFVYKNYERSFSDAVNDCNSRGLELLTMSTYRQYLDAREYFDGYSSVTTSWLALEFNTTSGNYQWLDGRVLTELTWLPGYPLNFTGTACGVIDARVTSRQWYSTLCTYSKYYICVGSDGSYSVGSTHVDFYKAVLNCQSEGRRLPVAITNLDTDWLNHVIDTTSMFKHMWLGLIEFGSQYGDYYRWVTGKHLTPPYTWANSDRFPIVHYHHSGFDKGFHSSDTSEREYICQTKSTKTAAVVRSPDKFVFVSNKALVLGAISKTKTINSLRRFQCALECLRDAGCIQYTIQGYLCRTFGESLVITDYSGGYMLWQRKIIS